ATLSIAIAVADNEVANDVEASIANATYAVTATLGGITLDAKESATINSTTAAASVAVSASLLVSGAVSGAGAAALNVILTTTKAFIDGSVGKTPGAVMLT